jgi:hypothetical protein
MNGVFLGIRQLCRAAKREPIRNQKKSGDPFGTAASTIRKSRALTCRR